MTTTTNMSPEDVSEAWQQFSSDRSSYLRDRLTEYYVPLVRRVAGKMAGKLPPNVDTEDLVQYGSMGLMRAVEHYDPSCGVAFETYVVPSIRGVILDELRTNDWAPRSLRKKVRELERAAEEFERKHDRSPRPSELAEILGVPMSDVVETLQGRDKASVKSLDVGAEDPEARSLHESIVSVDPELGPDGIHEQSLVIATIAGMIRVMPLQDRLVLTLYYYEHLTLADVGRVCGIPESRVSQIHTRAMMAVRTALRGLLAPVAG